MGRLNLEVLVGLFVLIGIAALAYLSIKLGKLEVLGSRGYTVTAEFDSIGGLKNGASVEIAGVEVGRVVGISLNNEEYRAVVTMRIRLDVKLQEDVIASIRTKGLIGEKYVAINPGAAETLIKDRGKIRETTSPVEVEELLGKYIFGSPGGEKPKP
ncbi:MAG: outer membrane lipid asymmetry maintenance protein MlaD [candidate division NC10 bacterium]|nr:outer membrane lipid asymmetry maintenance protein MlaD [candidate division NC10 bacterium]